MASTTSAWKIGFFGKGYGRTARTGQEPLDAGGEGRADSQEPSISEDFAKRMVPFYAQCLIEVEFPVLELAYPFLTFLCYRTLSKEGSAHRSSGWRIQRWYGAPALVLTNSMGFQMKPIH